MEHSKNYEKVYGYYMNGLWSKKMTWNAVGKNWITPDEYQEITGDTYPEEWEE